MSPFRLSYKGKHWVFFILTDVLPALIFASWLPLQRPKNRRETIEMLDNAKIKEEMQTYAYITLNIIFLIIIVILAVIIVLKYLP